MGSPAGLDNGAGMDLEVVEAGGRGRRSTNRRPVAAEHRALENGNPAPQA